MGDMLSQAEIDALLGGAAFGSSDEPEPGDGEAASSGETGADAAGKSDVALDHILTDEQKDIIGEIGNISMGTSATTLFALLGHKVIIDTPRVNVIEWRNVGKGYDRPCVGVRVDYKEGLVGSNILILKQRDVKIITNLMMGGDGSVGEDIELTEIDLSAIGEAMNQMVGSSSTSLSSMIKMKIDIDTPKAFVLDFNDNAFFDTVGFAPTEVIACVNFQMAIGDLIDSEIMQILPADFALTVIDALKSQFSADMAATQPSPPPAPAPKPQPAPPSPAPSAAPPQEYAPPQQIAPQPQAADPQPQYYAPQPQAVPPQQNINVQPVQFQSFDLNAVMQQKENIDIIMDVPLEVTVELGKTRRKIKEILEFTPGTVVELDKLAGEPIDILVNGKFVAKGEVVVIDENFGIRITSIISPENRI